MLLALFVAALLGGCAAKEPSRTRYFWPPPPDEPRIEYLGPYMSDADLRRDVDDWFADVVLGHAPPTTLFVQPFDVGSAGDGRVFVSDTASREVLVLDLNAGERRRLLGDHARPWLYFNTPLALAVDGDGGVYVSDMVDGRIYYFDSTEKVRYAFATDEVKRVTGMAVDDKRQRLYAVDAPANTVHVYDLQGRRLHSWGERGMAPGEFNFPLDVEVDGNGRLYVLDALNFRVQVFDPDGNFLYSFGEIGLKLGGFQLPKGIALDNWGHVYVTDSRAHQVLIFSVKGELLQVVGGYRRISRDGVAPGGMNLPSGIDIDSRGSIWVVDSLNRAVQRFQYLTPHYLRENPVKRQGVYSPEYN